MDIQHHEVQEEIYRSIPWMSMDILAPIQLPWIETYIHIHPEEPKNATIQMDVEWVSNQI
jgi:hypothetical protein